MLQYVYLPSYSLHIAHATSCQVKPSEYAFHDDSVSRAERSTTDCMKYPPRDGDMRIIYIHCNGDQLKLSDSDSGSNNDYTPASHYAWIDGSDGQLLFTFPTRVSLTTITLHYYSDSHRGLPRLRFYAVPDDFDVRDAPTTSYPYIDFTTIQPSRNQTGHRNVRMDINFNTKKVYMYKYSSSFQLALSEVEFLTDCSSKLSYVINM